MSAGESVGTTEDVDGCEKCPRTLGRHFEEGDLTVGDVGVMFRVERLVERAWYEGVVFRGARLVLLCREERAKIDMREEVRGEGVVVLSSEALVRPIG